MVSAVGPTLLCGAPRHKGASCLEDQSSATASSLSGRLSSKMSATQFRPWDLQRYALKEVVHPSIKHQCLQIEIHHDIFNDCTVAVKRYLSPWMSSFEEFTSCAASVCNPWNEILALAKIGAAASDSTKPCYEVFLDPSSGDVLLRFLDMPDCDLFQYCHRLGPIGPRREDKAFRMFESLLAEIFKLHKLGFAHGHITAENIWVQQELSSRTRRIAFLELEASTGTSTASRLYAKDDPCAAPEAFTPGYDVKAADLFSCGVLGFALATGRYPWFSTRPGHCRAFDFVSAHGIEKYFSDSRCILARKLGCVSPKYQELLKSLLSLKPEERLIAFEEFSRKDHA